MAFVTRQVTRTSQPQELVGASSYLLSRSPAALVSAPTPSFDLVSDAPITMAAFDIGSIPTLGVRAKGRTLVGNRVNATAGGVISVPFPAVPIAGDVTLIFSGGGFNTSANGTIVAIRSTTTTDPVVQLDNNNSDLRFIVRNNALSIITITATGAALYTGSKVIIARRVGAAMSLWVNGVQVASSASGPTGALSANSLGFFAGMAGASGWAAPNPGFAELFCVLGAGISDAEIKSISANPWQLFEPITETLWMPDAVAGGGLSLAAAAAAQAASTADISKGVSLAAAVLIVATGTAGMSLAAPLAATATGQAASNGQMALSVTFAANALSSALATAGITLGKSLGAAATGQAAGIAALDVVAAGSVINLAANAQGQATGSATLSLAINLSAAAVAQATAAAAFSGSVSLAAAAIANAQASAALAVGKPMGAIAQAQASTGAALWLDVPLSAAALAQAVAAGALNLTVNLAASSVSNASAGAILPSEILLSADGLAVSTASAALTAGGTNRRYPLASATQAYQLAAIMQAYPLAGQTQHFPLEGLA